MRHLHALLVLSSQQLVRSGSRTLPSRPVPFKISAPAGRHEASEVSSPYPTPPRASSQNQNEIHRHAHGSAPFNFFLRRKISASVLFPPGFISFRPAMRCGLITDRILGRRQGKRGDDGAPPHAGRRRRWLACQARDVCVRFDRLAAAGGSDTNVTWMHRWWIFLGRRGDELKPEIPHTAGGAPEDGGAGLRASYLC